MYLDLQSVKYSHFKPLFCNRHVRSTTVTPRFLFIHFSVNVATSQDIEPHTPNERMQKTSQLETGSLSLNRSIIEMGSHHEPKRRPVMVEALPRVSLQFEIHDTGNPRNWPMKMKIVVSLFAFYTGNFG